MCQSDIQEVLNDRYWDGGSLNNQNMDREGYGSFMTFHNGVPVTMTIDRGKSSERRIEQVHVKWPGATNNESEWKTLIVALTYALQVQSETHQKLYFRFHGDSNNVILGMTGENQIKAPNPRPLYEYAKGLADILDAEFVKEDDTTIKAILGH